MGGDVQKSRNEANRRTVSWQARGLTREGAHTRLFLPFSFRNSVVKSPSSTDNYKSGFDSYIPHIFLYSKREREKFPLSKIFTFVNPKRFCW